MPAATFSTAASTIKALMELGKSALDLRDGAIKNEAIQEIQSKLSEAYSQILEAKVAAMDMVTRYDEVLEKINSLNEWEREKQRYVLTQLDAGRFVYRFRNDAKPEEPAHDLCATCFDRKSKSILQRKYSNAGVSVFLCNLCKSELIIGSPEPVQQIHYPYWDPR